MSRVCITGGVPVCHGWRSCMSRVCITGGVPVRHGCASRVAFLYVTGVHHGWRSCMSRVCITSCVSRVASLCGIAFFIIDSLAPSFQLRVKIRRIHLFIPILFRHKMQPRNEDATAQQFSLQDFSSERYSGGDEETTLPQKCIHEHNRMHKSNQACTFK
jgi:hypothetical protein